MKRIDNHQIDNLAQEQLGNFEILPPEDMWSRIEHDLDKGERAPADIPRFKWAPIAAAAAIALLLAPFLSTSVQQKGKKAAESIVAELGSILDNIDPSEHTTHEEIVQRELYSAQTTTVQTEQTSIVVQVETPEAPVQHTERLIPFEQSLSFAKGNLTKNDPSQVILPRDWTSIEEAQPAAAPSYADLWMNSQKQSGSWKMGAMLSPEVAFSGGTQNMLKRNDNEFASTLSTTDSPDIPRNLRPVLAFAAGFQLEKALGKRFALRSGLLYSIRRGETGAINDSYAFLDHTSARKEYMMHYMKVPLALKVNVVSKSKFNYYITGGIAGNFFLSYREKNLESGAITRVAKPLVPSQLDLLFSTGFEFEVFPRLFLGIEPAISYAVAAGRYSFSQYRPIAMTFNTGLTYRL